MEKPASRFLRSAMLCRSRDLKQLVILGDLVKSVSELIHALQKERGASAIFLGSNGGRFTRRLAARVAQCTELECTVRERLEQVDAELDRMSCGARLYTRVALAFRALDTLPNTRGQIVSLTSAPQDAVKAFTEIIACLLAIGFEVADIAADPTVSRALVALVNFAQGKEYAGQERATAGGPFSRGVFLAADKQRIKNLVAAQDKAFRIFHEFADPAYCGAFTDVTRSRDTAQVRRMREMLFDDAPIGATPGELADAWFEHATRRIDAMRAIEQQMADDLASICAAKLAQINGDCERTEAANVDGGNASAPVAMLVMNVDPALNHGLEGGIGFYALDSELPKPMRSILEVIQAQSRHIDDISNQLLSARVALTERKVIEQAKGLVMQARRLSEKDAYALIRQTAMGQNKRIFEVAETIVSMAELLKT
jgi:AmiR/NasT family two-component response regulator